MSGHAYAFWLDSPGRGRNRPATLPGPGPDQVAHVARAGDERGL